MSLGTIKIEVIEGKIILPDEVLTLLGLRPGDGVEVLLEGDTIVLQKNALNLVH